MYSSKHESYMCVQVIMTPTRELAMQISTVLSDVCRCFKAARHVQVVSIVGGMAEQKQRRLLTGKRRCHILVATPGRLCELMKVTVPPCPASLCPALPCLSLSRPALPHSVLT